ncbi:hypothetical protein [Nesterenkonia marinintestina]|uniref:hypothetical protein n=1 Tax=Nesterenkonia marinintestina TaxID=2979865 RepID=UPI0021BF0316|nr:hypothetical protein [Nesterenkonia sp. GX14115]
MSPTRHQDLKQTGWRLVLLWAMTAGTLATAAAAGLGLVVGGDQSAMSAAAGGGAVVVLSGLTLLLVDLAERHVPQLSIAAFFLGFLLKVAAFLLAFSVPEPPSWAEPAWAVCTGVAVLVIWQIAQVRAFARMRLTVVPQQD